MWLYQFDQELNDYPVIFVVSEEFWNDESRLDDMLDTDKLEEDFPVYFENNSESEYCLPRGMNVDSTRNLLNETGKFKEIFDIA